MPTLTAAGFARRITKDKHRGWDILAATTDDDAPDVTTWVTDSYSAWRLDILPATTREQLARTGRYVKSGSGFAATKGDVQSPTVLRDIVNPTTTRPVTLGEGTLTTPRMVRRTYDGRSDGSALEVVSIDGVEWAGGSRFGMDLAKVETVEELVRDQFPRTDVQWWVNVNVTNEDIERARNHIIPPGHMIGGGPLAYRTDAGEVFAVVMPIRV